MVRAFPPMPQVRVMDGAPTSMLTESSSMPHRGRHSMPHCEARSLASRGYFTGQDEVDVDFLGHFQNEHTGVLQSPLHIRHDEMRFGAECSAVDVDLHRHAEVMGRAMQGEGAGDLDG